MSGYDLIKWQTLFEYLLISNACNEWIIVLRHKLWAREKSSMVNVHCVEHVHWT